jgi:murein DD-endopeptidase MepM/ murein hydrolase activator NlpD
MTIVLTALRRLSAIALFTAFAATATEAQQPLLRAPWSGSAIITQGNQGATSHHDNGSWDNTYAIDIAKPGNAPFDVLAPAAGTVHSVKNDTSGSGGRQLRVSVNGYVLVFMHLSEIKPAFLTTGAPVRQGDVIAVSGGSGKGVENGWDTHLHFHIWSGVSTTSPDSRTMGIQRLWLKGPADSSYREYESKGDGVDAATRATLEDWAVADKTFFSDNTPPVAQQLLRNGNFDLLTTSTNATADWARTYFTGTDFFTLRGGAGSTWGRNGTAGYLYLGHANNSRQIVDSHTMTIPATATRVRFRYYVSIITEETAAIAYDTLRVSVVDGPTGWEHLVGHFDNRHKTANDSTNVPNSYVAQEVELTGYAGATVKLRFEARNDPSFITKFRIDEVTFIAE